MPKKPNYSFQKRAKEEAKSKKKDEKKKRMLEKKAASPGDGQEQPAED